MKIIVNYDLVDKAREAKTGFSLNRYCKKVGLCTGFVGGIKSIEVASGVTSFDAAMLTTSTLFLSYLAYFGLNTRILADLYKSVSVNDLNKLSSKLRDIFVETDADLLMETTALKTDYEVVLNDSSIPVLKQKKMLSVPVYSDWDNNYRELLQEHVIGSREYVLSHPEPEEEKVYSFGTKKMFNK